MSVYNIIFNSGKKYSKLKHTSQIYSLIVRSLNKKIYKIRLKNVRIQNKISIIWSKNLTLKNWPNNIINILVCFQLLKILSHKKLLAESLKNNNIFINI